VTAVADSMYGFGTTSWWLGSEDSFIELGRLQRDTKINYEMMMVSCDL